MSELCALVRDLLPEGYTYYAEKCIVLNDNKENPQFEAEFRVNLHKDNDIKQFLEELNSSSGCTFNKKSGRPDRHGQGNSDKARCSLTGFRKCCMNVFHAIGKENKEGFFSSLI